MAIETFFKALKKNKIAIAVVITIALIIGKGYTLMNNYSSLSEIKSKIKTAEDLIKKRKSSPVNKDFFSTEIVERYISAYAKVKSIPIDISREGSGYKNTVQLKISHSDISTVNRALFVNYISLLGYVSDSNNIETLLQVERLPAQIPDGITTIKDVYEKK